MKRSRRELIIAMVIARGILKNYITFFVYFAFIPQLGLPRS